MSSLNEDSDSIDIALNKHVDYPCVSKVILNNIEKEITNLDSSRKGTFKILLQNLSKKRQMYVVHYYAIYRKKNCVKRDCCRGS